MKIITGEKRERLEREFESLENDIEPAICKQYRSPFPEFMSEPGIYGNNVAVIGRFEFPEPIEIHGSIIQGPAFHYWYIRDDREDHEDENTKHFNVHRRILAHDSSGRLVQHSFTSDDHFHVTTSTAMAYIETTYLRGLGDEGPLAFAVDRELLHDLYEGQSAETQKAKS